MVNLVIMRHGEAEPQSSQDSQRQLTAKGRADVTRNWHNGSPKVTSHLILSYTAHLSVLSKLLS
ncbi:MAG: hypothetical protein U5L01_16780 [Rheinheimera sp.]|nr:hypothetical protein [Rheinheimera sp.]